MVLVNSFVFYGSAASWLDGISGTSFATYIGSKQHSYYLVSKFKISSLHMQSTCCCWLCNKDIDTGFSVQLDMRWLIRWPSKKPNNPCNHFYADTRCFNTGHTVVDIYIYVYNIMQERLNLGMLFSFFWYRWKHNA